MTVLVRVALAPVAGDRRLRSLRSVRSLSEAEEVEVEEIAVVTKSGWASLGTEEATDVTDQYDMPITADTPTASIPEVRTPR